MAMYGSQEAWGRFPNVTWQSGSGVHLHHQGDTDYLKEAGWFLDKDRDWKTKWSFQQGKGNQAHEWGMTGGYAGWSEDRDRWHRKDPGDRAAYTTGNWMRGTAPGQGPQHRGHKTALSGTALEQIDWDAYDKDVHYKNWLKEIGKDQFNTLQDIYDAEAWMAGGAITGKRHREELAELQAQLEKEKLLNQQRQENITPKHIDTGSSPQPVGGIKTQSDAFPFMTDSGGQVGAGGTVQLPGGGTATGHDWLNSPEYAQSIADLQAQWDAKLADKDAAHAQSIADLQAQWGTQSAAELADLQTSLQSQYAKDAATRDAQYQSQIQDLTSTWGAQKTGLEQQIGGLQADAQAYQGQIGGLTDQLQGLNLTIGEVQATNKAQQAMLQEYKEADIRDIERQRLAARYGAGGQPLNPQVQGVRTAKIPEQPVSRYYSPRQQFNRSGLRITNLNI